MLSSAHRYLGLFKCLVTTIPITQSVILEQAASQGPSGQRSSQPHRSRQPRPPDTASRSNQAGASVRVPIPSAATSPEAAAAAGEY